MPNTFATEEIKRLLGIKGGDEWEIVPAVQPVLDLTRHAAVPDLPIPRCWTGGRFTTVGAGEFGTFVIQTVGFPCRVRIRPGTFTADQEEPSKTGIIDPGTLLGAAAVTAATPKQQFYDAFPVEALTQFESRTVQEPIATSPTFLVLGYQSPMWEFYVPAGKIFFWQTGSVNRQIHIWAEVTEIHQNLGPA